VLSRSISKVSNDFKRNSSSRSLQCVDLLAVVAAGMSVVSTRVVGIESCRQRCREIGSGNVSNQVSGGKNNKYFDSELTSTSIYAGKSIHFVH
jgi:hypothetical protein